MILNGPVPEGFLANSAQLLPTASHCVGLTITMRVISQGLNGYLVCDDDRLIVGLLIEATIETAALTIGDAVASYCGDLSS